MDRRSFLAVAGGAGLSALAGATAFQRWREITPSVHYPGRAEGHYLRDRRKLPAPGSVIEADVVILGSGIAALTAAWKLNRDGHRGALMIDGPQPYGNAAGGHFGDLAYPTGGHYLPLPSPESVHVREILHDLGTSNATRSPRSRPTTSAACRTARRSGCCSTVPGRMAPFRPSIF